MKQRRWRWIGHTLRKPPTNTSNTTRQALNLSGTLKERILTCHSKFGNFPKMCIGQAKNVYFEVKMRIFQTQKCVFCFRGGIAVRKIPRILR